MSKKPAKKKKTKNGPITLKDVIIITIVGLPLAVYFLYNVYTCWVLNRVNHYRFSEVTGLWDKIAQTIVYGGGGILLLTGVVFFWRFAIKVLIKKTHSEDEYIDKEFEEQKLNV